MQRQGMVPRTAEESDRVENGLCVQCGSPDFEGKRTVYCSDKCYWVYWIKHDWSHLREYMLRKSKYTCAKCGFHKMREVYSSFVVDHIKPIFLGGAEFDPDNCQVLCIPCNKVKTAEDMAHYRARHAEHRRNNAVKAIDIVVCGPLDDFF